MKDIQEGLIAALGGEPEEQPTDAIDSGVDKDEELSPPAKKKLIIRRRVEGQPQVEEY